MTVLGLCCCVNCPPAAESRGYSIAVVCGLLTAASSLFAERGLQGTQASIAACGLSICGSRAREHGLNSCDAGFSCSTHVGSSWIRDGTHVSCSGRQILYHWATREAPDISFLSNLKLRKLQFSIFRHFFSLPAL